MKEVIKPKLTPQTEVAEKPTAEPKEKLIVTATQTPNKVTQEANLTQADDTSYTYCYVLSTLEQRKAIKLTKHKSKLEKIIKEFFTDRLLNLEFNDESYTLTLNELYTVGDKRRLGRLISEGSDLKQFVKKVIYNGNQDSSGQLFKLKKPSSVEGRDEKVQSK